MVQEEEQQVNKAVKPDNHFPGGVWPVMLTPFTNENQVDYEALGELVEWYISHGASGLFAVCQSSEMFFLSLKERKEIAGFVLRQVAGRVPVIASGHISDSFADQVEELNAIIATGVDCTILVTNRLAKADEDDDIWIDHLKRLMDRLPPDAKLGLYECPYPYKRLMTEKTTKWCAESGRFYFLKDTSCDVENIRRKLNVIRGSNLKLYNANTATLLESLQMGACGYSGVMANMQIEPYVKLVNDFGKCDLRNLSDRLTICALIERQYYPTNAKYYLSQEHLSILPNSRVQPVEGFQPVYKMEMEMLHRLTSNMEREYRLNP